MDGFASVAMETIAIDASQHLTAPAVFVCSTAMHAIATHDIRSMPRTSTSAGTNVRVAGTHAGTSTTTITTPIRRVRLVVFA